MDSIKISDSGRGLRSVLSFLLGALFFMLAIGITLQSSWVYRQTVTAADRNFTQRTALSYLLNQLRRSDVPGGVSLASFGGADAIVLDGGDYRTLLYCYDGQLRELYSEPGLGLLPEDGVPILPLSALSVQPRGNALSITVTDSSGDRSGALFSLRSGLSKIGGTP